MKPLISLCFTAILLALMAQQGSAAQCERENFFGVTTYFSCPQLTDSREDQFCCGTKEQRYCCDSPFGIDDEVVKQFAEKKLVALAQVQETPVVPQTANDQEGVRDVVNRAKDKVNGTVHSVGGKLNPKVGIQKAKDKVKQKIKDKVEEKAVKKLDPTGGHIKSLPIIIGVILAFILGLLVVCIVCCCCCPFCLIHKRRNRGAVHNPNTADVTVTQPLQPMPPQQPYPAGQQQPYAPQPYPPQQGYPPQQPYPPQQGGYPPQQGGYPPQQGFPAQPGYPQQPYPTQANPPAVYPDLNEQ